MSKFQHAQLDTLPNTWTVSFLKDLVTFRMGKTPHRENKEYWEEGKYPWVCISDMTPYGIVSDTAEKVSEKAHKDVFRTNIVPAGHILMSFKLTIGRVSRLAIPAYHNEAIISFKPDPNIIDENYLIYYLSQINYHNYLDKAIKGNTLNKSKLSVLEIVRPPLSEQRKIAAILSVVRQGIERQELLMNLTAELKRVLMEKLFNEGIYGEPREIKEIGDLPQSWSVRKLQDLIEHFQYGTSVKCDYNTNGYPVLRIPNVVGGKVDFSDLKFGTPKPNEIEKLKLQPGDLLFVRTNGVRENAGRCSIYNGELLGQDCYFASYLIRIRTNPSLLYPAFLNEYTRTPTGVSFLSGRAIRTADGKFNINSGTLQQVLLPLPKLDEQKEIADILATIDKKIDYHQSLRDSLQQLFLTLLHKLMTAEIRVDEVDLSELAELGIGMAEQI